MVHYVFQVISSNLPFPGKNPNQMAFTIPKPPTPKPSTRHHTNQPTPSDTAHSIDMCLDILSQSPRDACGENWLMDGSLDEKDSTPLRPSSSTIYHKRNWVSKSKSKSCLLFYPSSRHLFRTLFLLSLRGFWGWGWCDWYTLRIETAHSCFRHLHIKRAAFPWRDNLFCN